jgi:hypothetical protein
MSVDDVAGNMYQARVTRYALISIWKMELGDSDINEIST